MTKISHFQPEIVSFHRENKMKIATVLFHFNETGPIECGYKELYFFTFP